MQKHLKNLLILIIVSSLSFFNNLNAETTDVKEILEIIQKDLRTLERAVYSESFSASSSNSKSQGASMDREIMSLPWTTV